VETEGLELKLLLPSPARQSEYTLNVQATCFFETLIPSLLTKLHGVINHNTVILQRVFVRNTDRFKNKRI